MTFHQRQEILKNYRRRKVSHPLPPPLLGVYLFVEGRGLRVSCRGRGYHVEGRGYLFSQFLLINGSGQKYHTGAGPTFRGELGEDTMGLWWQVGGVAKDTMGLWWQVGGSGKTPWVSECRWGGGGSARTPWVSDGRWEGRQKHRGSPMVGGAGGVGKDTMDLWW